MDKEQHIEVDRFYHGLRYIVRFRSQGFRCGYIQVPSSDVVEWRYINDHNIDDAFFDCHGGVTFSGEFKGKKEDFLPVGNWIGFDCIHAKDGYDHLSVKRYFGKNLDSSFFNGEAQHVWSSEEVEAECKNLIDQYNEFRYKFRRDFSD